MLTNSMPYKGYSLNSLLRNINNTDINFEADYFSKYSTEFKDFLKKLLERSPNNRFSAK